MSKNVRRAAALAAALVVVAACAPLGGRPATPAVRAGAGEGQAEPGGAVLVDLNRAFAEVHDRVAPSIVTVAAYARDAGAPPAASSPAGAWVRRASDDYPGFRLVASGSGVVLTPEGDILTNRHLLLKEDGEPADLIDVETVDNRHTICRVVGLEPTLNLGIVALEVFSEASPPQFEPIAFGNSAEVLQGHLTLAVGDPFGPEKFLGFGLLASSPTRDCYQEQLSATYLQVSMRAHPGAHGGALVNVRGEFVGLLTPREPGAPPSAGESTELALPSNIIQGLYRTIKKNEMRRSPWLGYAVMSVAELHREVGAEAFGALERPLQGIWIENVFDPSPAHGAGIRPGDWLTRFDGTYIGSPLDFQKALYMAGIGSTVELELFRGGETFTVSVTIEERPQGAVTR